MKHILFKINSQHLESWRIWCRYLVQHAEEAKLTMRQENCIYERCILFQAADNWYVVGSVSHDGEQLPADMSIQLNKEHKFHLDLCLGLPIAKFKGDFVLPKDYEVLYEFIL